MTRGKKIALGIATVWPLVYVGLFLLFMLVMVFQMADPESSELLRPSGDGGPPPFVLILFPAHICTMAVSFGLVIVYVVLVIKNPRLSDTMRIIWSMLIMFGGMLSMPVYFWMEVWRAPEGPNAGSDATAAPDGEGGFATPPGS